MKIDLSAEERLVLLHLIRDALASTKYPLAPGLKVLRDLGDKLAERKIRKRRSANAQCSGFRVRLDFSCLPDLAASP